MQGSQDSRVSVLRAQNNMGFIWHFTMSSAMYLHTFAIFISFSSMVFWGRGHSSHHFNGSEADLFRSLIYMCIDIQYEWDGFASCRRPIHKWLLLSYGLVVMSRLIHLAGALMFLDRKKKVGLLGASGVIWSQLYSQIELFFSVF